MKHLTRIKLLILAMSLGVTVVALMMVGLSTASATGSVDFTLAMDAPAHVAVDSDYVVRIIYYNQGTGVAPDVWMAATIPEGTQFVTATDRQGDPLPPDAVDGSTLTWTFVEPLCHKPEDACCGHIVMTLHTDEDLLEQVVLETTATIGTSVVESDMTNNEASASSAIGAMAGSTKQVHARHVMPGDVLSYTIKVDFSHQPGSGTWRDVVLTDTLPFSHQVRFLNWQGTVTGTMIDGHNLRWQGRVQAGEPLTLQYRLGVEGVITPGTVISNVAMLGWDGGHMQLGPVTTVVTSPHGTMALGPYQGGQLFHHQHRVTLTVPPGTVTDTTRFQFRPLLTDTHPITPPGGLLFANRAFELNAFRFGDPVREFSRPLTITMHYTDADVAGLNRETLRLWTRTGPDVPWAMLGEPARVTSGALAFTTTHFSQFALFGEADTATGSVDFTLAMDAPAHVAVDSDYVVRIIYYNQGTGVAPIAWVTATIPEGTQFVTATDRQGDPLPPDAVGGSTLTWTFVEPLCHKPEDACCGHIVMTLHTDEDLLEGTELETTATIGTSVVESDMTNNEASAPSAIGAMAGSTKQVHARHVMPGDVLSYTIRVDFSHQPGSASWRNVVLTDTLPFSHQVRFLNWQGTVTGTMIDGHKLRWQGQVQAGEPLTLQYRLGVEGVITPGTVISNVAMLGWDGGYMQLGPVTTVVTSPHGTMALGPYEGGQLHHEYGVTLTVPPGTLTDTTRFQFRPLLTDTHPITPPGDLLFANRAFELNAFRFGDPVREFSRPLTITMNYTDADVAGLKRETARLWMRTDPDGPWAELGEPARVMSRALAFTTTHFSQFALFAEGKVDLAVDVKAPAHVLTDSLFVANVSYANIGRAEAPASWVRATLPEGTQFFTATDGEGLPLPPDVTNSNVLTWNIAPLPAKSSWNHILITLHTDEDLSNGTALTTTASILTTGEERDTANNVASDVSVVSEMAGTTKQVHARHVMPGDALTYTITMSMAHQFGGGENGRWVVLTDTLPFSHQVRFLNWQGTVTGTVIDGHELRWQGQVQAGEPLTLQYRLGVEGVVTPGTIISNVAMLGWEGGHMQLGPVTTVVTLPHGTMAVGPYEGGQLYHQHGVTLAIPPGAVTDTTRFQFRPLLTDTHPITPPGGLLFANRAFELNAFRFGEPVREFSRPLTITMNYTDTDVAGLKRETVRLWTRTGPDVPWAMLGEPARVMSGALVFTTTHLSQFALFGEAVTTTDDVDFTLQVYAPAHVAVDSDYVVRIIYYNQGTGIAPDAWVTATIPEGTQFVTAIDQQGDPLPPDAVDGNTLSWAFVEPLCHKPEDACCGHVVMTLHTDENLPEGTVLTTTASVGTSVTETNTTNNEASEASVIGAMAGSMKQVHARHVMPGDALTYTITIRLAHQPGGGLWQDVTLTDTLPFSHQVRFLGWTGALSGTVTDGTAELPRQMLRWQGRVQAGEPLTLQYRLGVEGVVTPGTVISNVAMLGWEGGHMQLGPVTTVVTLPHGTMALGPYEGGQLYHQHGVTLAVPPGTVTDTTRFQFRPLFTDTLPTSPPGGLLFANRAFELSAFRFGEPVREFSRPLTITMNYTDTDVAGLKRETVRLWTRTGPDVPWAMLGEPARVMSGTLAFTTTHLSQFALFGEAQYHSYLPLVLR